MSSPEHEGSDWGMGPPQLATFDGAGRQCGTSHDPRDDSSRRERVRATEERLREAVALIRANLPA
ncbi:hypothetical protein CSC68_06215 [Pseudoxanthomonas suwonensis]|nr:hypothetical protein CSC68_06215 [Pseudoxanthomonas suwonensis]